MSSSDILDVLNINEETRVKSKEKRKTSDFAASGISKKKKMGSLNRELYNLIGSSAPPISVEKSLKFKDKLKNSKPTPWSWQPYKNGARSDSLELHHWVKGEVAVDQPYQFEKFNKKLEIPELTEADYNLYLVDLDTPKEVTKEEDSSKDTSTPVTTDKKKKSDIKDKDEVKTEEKIDDKKDSNSESKDQDKGPEKKETEEQDSTTKEKESEKEKVSETEVQTAQEVKPKWTYDETKYLFDLCNDFDLRWPIIFDRYEYPEGPERSVDDLKEQFYRCSAILLKHNGAKDNKTNTLIQSLEAYDKNKEKERKAYLLRLLHRSPTEIAEEESLVIEARKFELAAKKMLTERAQLLQLLDSPQSSASIQQYLTSQGLTQLYNSLITVDKSKKRKPEVPVAPQLGPNAMPHNHHQEMQRQRAIAAAAATASTQSATSAQGTSSSNEHHTKANGHAHHTGNKKSDKKGSSSAASTSANTEKSEIQELINSKLSAEDQEIYGLRYHEERLVPGVIIRSNKLSSYKPVVQARIGEILNEMGLSIKPTIPTGKVCMKFDQLLQSIATLIDVKKQTDKLQTEINLLKHQKGLS